MGEKREDSTGDEGSKPKHKKLHTYRQPRQRPISCRLCRVRKLRCSRIFPCSNCTSRGVECQHEETPQAACSVPIREVGDSATKEVPTADILLRLERLEALVASQAPPQKQRSETNESSPRPEANPQQPSQTPNPNPYLHSRLQRLTADALWLERSCVSQKLLDDLSADPITFRSCPIRLITQPSSLILVPVDSASPLSAGRAVKCIWIPRRDEAQSLVQKYISDLNHFHHILHAPSTPTFIDTNIYDALDQGAAIHLGALLLLLGMSASSMYAWTPRDDARCLFVSAAEAHAQTNAWFKAALDVSSHVQRATHTSLECVQGLIIIFFALCSIEGITSRVRTIMAQAIAMARELGLNLIDRPGNHSDLDRANCVKTEVGRRVWWYLTATDWALSQFTTTQEGICTIHPSQMFVRKPRNINDEDLIDGQEVIERPLEEPTSVSYLLQRIRLTQVLYGLMDKSPFVLSPETMDYAQVKDADASLKLYMREIPPFLRLDGADSTGTLPMGADWSQLLMQRYTLNILLHRHLCKLHLPYLARGTVDAAYAFSHTECLKSARIIVHVEHQLRALELELATSRQLMHLLVRSVFIACIVLVLDACLQSDDGQGGATNSHEIVDVWNILNDARDTSLLVPKILDLSIQVLQKHKPRHPSLKTFKQLTLAKNGIMGETPPLTPESGRDKNQMGMLAPQTSSGPDSFVLDPGWQELQGMNLEAVDWDRLFGGLDAPFM